MTEIQIRPSRSLMPLAPGIRSSSGLRTSAVSHAVHPGARRSIARTRPVTLSHTRRVLPSGWGVQPFMVDTAENVADSLTEGAWTSLSAGDGTKGPRLHDWAYLPLAHLEADEYVEGAEGRWTRGLLIRRHRADRELVGLGLPRSHGRFVAWELRVGLCCLHAGFVGQGERYPRAECSLTGLYQPSM